MSSYYTVVKDIDGAPLRDHLMHGYETEYDFRHALWAIVDLWKGRVGECIDERHGFLLLRFHDTPGSKPDEAWIPEYLLRPADAPECEPFDEGSSDGFGPELDMALGFD